MIENLGSVLRDGQFKDESPVRTVEKIKSIMAENGIETEERWGESGVAHCHSLRLSLNGSFFGVNGKGMTPEFARASAYAEFMERMQLGMLGKAIVQKTGYYNEYVGNYIDVSVNELLNSKALKNNWYDTLSENLYHYTKVKMSGEDILRQYAVNDKVACLPFYNVMNGQTVYIPNQIRNVIFGSNGAAAGNTIEEAIVQALSEIMERANKTQILTENISVPDIPEEVLKDFKAAYSVITELREKGIKVTVKDCSLGEKFPVVCVCYINTHTGRYRVHFGANPVLEIALERALTESFQGSNIKDFAKCEDLLYQTEEIFSYKSIYNELRTGVYEKTPGFFINKPTIEYNSDMGFDGVNNKELLHQLIVYFKARSKEIIVYNASCLGFPTCQVIIPGFSEVIYNNLSKEHSIYSHSDSAIKTLRNPSKATLIDALGLLKHIDKMAYDAKRDLRMRRLSVNAKLALLCDYNEDRFLMYAATAFVYFELGRYNEVKILIDKMIRKANDEDIEYLICLKRLFGMKQNKFSSQDIRKTLEFLHKSETVDEVYSCFEEKRNPFEKYTLKCDVQNCADCRMLNKCGQKYTNQLIAIINQKTKQLDFKAFAEYLNQYVSEN